MFYILVKIINRITTEESDLRALLTVKALEICLGKNMLLDPREAFNNLNKE